MVSLAPGRQQGCPRHEKGTYMVLLRWIGEPVSLGKLHGHSSTYGHPWSRATEAVWGAGGGWRLLLTLRLPQDQPVLPKQEEPPALSSDKCSEGRCRS